ncbi:alpha/beta hydrolase family protein [Mycolicibacterium sediminis]|uniref:Lipase n=1 Tax=Mycolicibacterium sediminis TaxID=1286180 RepID=A0A7I7QI71_9MYCO|nr:prolyl oligopeptidase family serine peptidase [Mycolicibacterium sediminis]BBY25964.1 lipase [Mycolicibacterium sediminis]
MRRTSILLTTALLALSTLVAPVAHAAAPVWSGLNASDYSGPIGAPGTLVESVPLDPAVTLPAAGSAYRFLYSTVDARDQPAVSTAAVFLPRGAAPDGGWPIVAWAHGTVGLGDDCTPSAHPRNERDVAYLGHWLDQGYAVVASDYAGLGTPGVMAYLDTVSTAHGVVDSVVAAHRMALPLSPRWAVVGQSQGGAGAVGTARYATEFSAGSGLDYRGAVATGTPAFIEEIVGKAGPDMALPPELGSGANAYSAYILAAFRAARPDLNLDRILSPVGLDAVARAEVLCYQDLAAALATSRPSGFFTATLASVPGAEAALTEYMGIPTSGYDRPVFLGVGLRDRDVPPSSSLRLDEAMRANGQPVELHVYPDEDHSGTVLASIPDSTPFLARLMS